MAGSLQQQFAETIFAMKKRIVRPPDSSDSEDLDAPFRDRRQSLKRKVQYIRSGDEDQRGNSTLGRKRIVHAGYHRAILQRNPLRYDPDGDIVDAGDEYEDEDDLSEVEENPYANIHLEAILAPLRSPADLPNHPSYSSPYTSKHLTRMANEADFVARKEHVTLVHARSLFNKLQGDSSFAPQALAALDLAPLHQDRPGSFLVPGTSIESALPSKLGSLEDRLDEKSPEDTTMGDANSTIATNGHDGSIAKELSHETEPMVLTNGLSHAPDTAPKSHNEEQGPTPPEDDASETASQQTAHRMTTRARAHAASTPSPPSSPTSTIHQIHPIFLCGTDSIPDRDLGLPPNEAEETRMLLMAYVQKQDEIARAATDLCHGILHGERMRQDVFKWAKAEAHVGEMSDGEDWYDREEWGLDHALLKGRDEEEDEATAAGKKSTRQRRKPDKDDR